MILDRIKEPNDIKKIPSAEWKELAQEIREFIIENVSKTGGHLSSNLGAIELTMALHLAFHLPEDKIIWDVGHQSYTHKILTGRKDEFDKLRQYGGISGFPKRCESDCDVYDTGHSSNSISAGLGFVAARDLAHDNYNVISVIGDGAMTGGLAFEGLNNAAILKKNFIIVLNDNTMSISRNVGGLPMHLSNIRTADRYRDLKQNVINSLSKIPKYGDKMVSNIRKTKSSLKQLLIPGMIFENLGATYLGPFDGHDTMSMLKVFVEASKIQGPVVIHVLTQKGKGYIPAQLHPDRFHGTGAFDIESAMPLKEQTQPNYTNVFSSVISKMAQKDEKIVAITAAMEDGVGLKKFKKLYPDRFFDVGIAEGHAVSFGAGLAMQGYKPVIAIYSSFLQRAYDEIITDVALQKLPVIFAVDRAGIVGADGETHQGIFDLSYLCSIPGMVVMAPKNKWELADMLRAAFEFNRPVAIRYPKGTAWDGLQDNRAKIELGKSEVIKKGSGILLFALGSMVKSAYEVSNNLKEQGIDSTLVNARFAMPFDKEMLKELSKKHDLIVTFEENVRSGGFSQHIESFIKEENIDIDIMPIALEDDFIEHGDVNVLKEKLCIDEISITDRIISYIKGKNK